MSVACFTKIMSALKVNTPFKCVRESSSIPCQVNTGLSSLAHGVQESLSCSCSELAIASPGIHTLAGQTSLCYNAQGARQWTLHHHQVRRAIGHAWIQQGGRMVREKKTWGQAAAAPQRQWAPARWKRGSTTGAKSKRNTTEGIGAPT